MIRITGIPFTGYPVTDLARSRAFYEGVLGLQTGDTWIEGEGGWVEYGIGSATLAITNGAPQWKPSGDGPAVALEVEDVDAAAEHLRAHGVKFVIDPADSPVCRMAVIADPDGNCIAIHKRKAPAATA
ncbi:VOC family protein [Opitutales bacterium ASA1]|uniref:VOC family protein n=1 Tax=Congregicoccus parvus TaxID=3081749 RepID=UPI002B3263FA|nr:VOC family protein [Opitutales bacterium ASA1]